MSLSRWQRLTAAKMRKTTRAAAGAAPGSAPGAESSTGTGKLFEEWAMIPGSIHGKRREGLISRG